MAITIQSVFTPSDTPAAPASGAAAKSANPFAMFFANQMKSPGLRGAALTGSDSKLPVAASHADSAAATPAPDVAAMLAAGLILPRQAAIATPAAAAAATDAATAAASAVPGDTDTVARARAQLQQAQAQLQLAQQQLQQAQAVQQQGEPAAAGSSPLLRQVQDAARLAAADPLAAPSATAGDAADVAFADQAAAVLRQLAGSRKSQSESQTSKALQQVGTAVTSQTLPGPVAAAGTGNAASPLTLKSEGLSAAIAARVSLRDEAAQQHKDDSLQALPSSFAAVRQELPSTPATPAAVQVPGTMDRSKEWGEAFNQQIMNTVAKQLDQATFHVTPEKLGPIEISIAMNKDQAQITLTTSNAQARDIVESHLPALSKMMEHAGLHLAEAQVSNQPQGQSQQQAAQQQAQQQAQQHAQQQGRRQEQPRFDLAALSEAEAVAPAQGSAAAGLSVAA